MEMEHHASQPSVACVLQTACGHLTTEILHRWVKKKKNGKEEDRRKKEEEEGEEEKEKDTRRKVRSQKEEGE
jgi:hypothetical protein